MYNLHHTEGVVLSFTDFGEADRIYNIYTRDFGKISVLAKGIRLEKSKLRGHLVLYALIRLSFVEGKEFMRLTDAEEILCLPLNESAYLSLASSGVFLDRMIKGQEKDEAVWKLLRSVYQCISNTECLIKSGFIPLFKVRLLHRLGYVSSKDQLVTGNDWSDISDSSVQLNKLRKTAELSLSASQL